MKFRLVETFFSKITLSRCKKKQNTDTLTEINTCTHTYSVWKLPFEKWIIFHEWIHVFNWEKENFIAGNEPDKSLHDSFWKYLVCPSSRFYGYKLCDLCLVNSLNVPTVVALLDKATRPWIKESWTRAFTGHAGQVRSGQVRVIGASGHSILSADYCVTVSYGSLIINVTSMTFTFTTSDERKRHKINSQCMGFSVKWQKIFWTKKLEKQQNFTS